MALRRHAERLRVAGCARVSFAETPPGCMALRRHAESEPHGHTGTCPGVKGRTSAAAQLELVPERRQFSSNCPNFDWGQTARRVGRRKPEDAGGQRMEAWRSWVD